jgi:hypothetical protein
MRELTGVWAIEKAISALHFRPVQVFSLPGPPLRPGARPNSTRRHRRMQHLHALDQRKSYKLTAAVPLFRNKQVTIFAFDAFYQVVQREPPQDRTLHNISKLAGPLKQVEKVHVGTCRRIVGKRGIWKRGQADKITHLLAETESRSPSVESASARNVYAEESCSAPRSTTYVKARSTGTEYACEQKSDRWVGISSYDAILLCPQRQETVALPSQNPYTQRQRPRETHLQRKGEVW